MAKTAYVALLRGINLLGHRRISMPALEAIFTSSGAKNVRSYIQSGNVVFEAPAGSLKRIAAHVEKEVNRGHGFQCIFTTRSADEMAAVVAGNPFKKKVCDGKTLHVVFLADAPSGEKIALLDPNRSPGDEFRVVGREVYLYLPNGIARTKLSNQWLDSKLKTMSTVRNWNTVNNLAEMMKVAS
jgi:uncharacterized protein (DUF1697 family)